MKQIFKVNDKVFDPKYGWGIVISISHELICPVRVKFDCGIQSYTYNGGRYTNDTPILSFTECFSQERPKK